ncbi:MAG: hypothetical protein IKX24_07745 [Prevotella sp.]|nr:hypothetical protein [Prevotella sp.]MBR5062020.1 hypothetical protein [Prevotella sp.]
MKIQANASGSRSIDVTEQHLRTIEAYSLLDNLVDSNGIIDENVLDKLKFNVRAILESGTEGNKELLDLCLDVIYNNHMKAFGLENLFKLYQEWKGQKAAETDDDTATETV